MTSRPMKTTDLSLPHKKTKIQQRKRTLAKHVSTPSPDIDVSAVNMSLPSAPSKKQPKKVNKSNLQPKGFSFPPLSPKTNSLDLDFSTDFQKGRKKRFSAGESLPVAIFTAGQDSDPESTTPTKCCLECSEQWTYCSRECDLKGLFQKLQTMRSSTIMESVEGFPKPVDVVDGGMLFKAAKPSSGKTKQEAFGPTWSPDRLYLDGLLEEEEKEDEEKSALNETLETEVDKETTQVRVLFLGVFLLRKRVCACECVRERWLGGGRN